MGNGGSNFELAPAVQAKRYLEQSLKHALQRGGGGGACYQELVEHREARPHHNPHRERGISGRGSVGTEEPQVCGEANPFAGVYSGLWGKGKPCEMPLDPMAWAGLPSFSSLVFAK